VPVNASRGLRNSTFARSLSPAPGGPPAVQVDSGLFASTSIGRTWWSKRGVTSRPRWMSHLRSSASSAERWSVFPFSSNDLVDCAHRPNPDSAWAAGVDVFVAGYRETCAMPVLEALRSRTRATRSMRRWLTVSKKRGEPESECLCEPSTAREPESEHLHRDIEPRRAFGCRVPSIARVLEPCTARFTPPPCSTPCTRPACP